MPGVPDVPQSVHDTLLKILATNDKSLIDDREELLARATKGKIDLSSLGNASAILTLLTQSHLDNILKNQEPLDVESFMQPFCKLHYNSQERDIPAHLRILQVLDIFALC